MSNPTIHVLVCCAKLIGQDHEFCQPESSTFYRDQYTCFRAFDKLEDNKRVHCHCAEFGDVCKPQALLQPHAAPARGVPGPIAGAGIPMLALAYGAYRWLRRV